ncbi:MAG: hypothetical protein QGH40_02570 [bacterium]|nr:hypothetical protein [bacterium]
MSQIGKFFSEGISYKCIKAVLMIMEPGQLDPRGMETTSRAGSVI